MDVHRRSSKTNRGQADGERRDLCFVIMPLGDPFDRYFNNIYIPAVTAAGLEPVRADSLFRPSPILEDIWSFTRTAKVLLADLSDRNPNVFYEVGLAHAIAKPVILVAGSIDDVPFDLRGLRVLLYNKDNESWGNDLRSNLESALRETISDVSGAVPPTFLRASATANRIPEEDPLNLRLRRIEETVRGVVMSVKEPVEPRIVYVDRHVPIFLPPDIAKTIRATKPQMYALIPGDADLATAIGMVAANMKINAIKFIREKTSLGLRESKDVADAVQTELSRLGHLRV